MHIFFGKVMRYIELREKIKNLFQENGLDDFSDIDWIMVEVLGVSRTMLPFYGDINGDKEHKIMEAVKKRLNHVPIAYIFGKTNFYGYDLKVNENVLIPRLDTEVLVEKVIEDIKSRNEKVSVLDLGTGSGAIIITIQKETNSKCYAVDVSKKALSIASENAKNNYAEVEFIESDLFENISDLKVDYIVSNPPYIETEVVKGLEPEVVLNEPNLALDGGKDGLDFYRKIIKDAKHHLNKNGKLYFEIGYNQGKSVSDLMKENFENIEVIKDYGGNNRVVRGVLRG